MKHERVPTPVSGSANQSQWNKLSDGNGNKWMEVSWLAGEVSRCSSGPVWLPGVFGFTCSHNDPPEAPVNLQVIPISGLPVKMCPGTPSEHQKGRAITLLDWMDPPPSPMPSCPKGTMGHTQVLFWSRLSRGPRCHLLIFPSTKRLSLLAADKCLMHTSIFAFAHPSFSTVLPSFSTVWIQRIYFLFVHLLKSIYKLQYGPNSPTGYSSKSFLFSTASLAALKCIL